MNFHLARPTSLGLAFAAACLASACTTTGVEPDGRADSGGEATVEHLARQTQESPDGRWLATVDHAGLESRLLLVDQSHDETWELHQLPGGELRGINWLGDSVLAIHTGAKITAARVLASDDELQSVEQVAITMSAEAFSRQMAADKNRYNPVRSAPSGHYQDIAARRAAVAATRSR
jgi:hypothetical protein